MCSAQRLSSIPPVGTFIPCTVSLSHEREKYGDDHRGHGAGDPDIAVNRKDNITDQDSDDQTKRGFHHLTEAPQNGALAALANHLDTWPGRAHPVPMLFAVEIVIVFISLIAGSIVAFRLGRSIAERRCRRKNL
jgi:hypothetical protein